MKLVGTLLFNNSPFTFFFIRAITLTYSTKILVKYIYLLLLKFFSVQSKFVSLMNDEFRDAEKLSTTRRFSSWSFDISRVNWNKIFVFYQLKQKLEICKRERKNIYIHVKVLEEQFVIIPEKKRNYQVFRLHI